MTTSTTLKPFTLADAGGAEYRFPRGRLALLCFVKEDCPTCRLSMPLLEAAHRGFGDMVDVWAIGQDTLGNAVLVEQYGLTVPVLDDDALISNRIDYALLLAWNFSEEIMNNLKEFREGGGKFIIPIPHPKILG